MRSDPRAAWAGASTPLYAALACALAAALCYPLARVYWFESHELFDYVSRTVEYAEALRRGELYPRWSPSFYGSYGSPFFNFYAPMIYALGGTGTLLLGSPTLALKCVVVLGTLLAALGTFALVQLETRRADAGFVAAGLYLAAPYRLADLSWRGDLAELFALGVLPVALYAYRRIAHEQESAKLPRRVSYAVLAHAALVLSHTILGLWGTGLIALVAALSALQAVRDKRPARALLYVTAFGCAILASAIYTLPALAEKPFVRTDVMVQTWTAPLNNLLAFAALFQKGPFGVGWTLVAALCAVVIAACVARKRVRLPLAWCAAACGLSLLVLPIAAPIWKSGLVPFGDYIQFPWRLLGPAALCASIAVGLAWVELLPARLPMARWLAPPLAAGVVTAAVLFAMPRVALHPMDMEKVMLSTERIQSRWIRGTALDEYLPRAVTRTSTSFARSVLPASDAVKAELVHSAGTRHALTLNVASTLELELNLHAFPGWSVRTRQGPAQVALDTSAQGLVQLRFPRAGRYVLDVAFGSTPVRTLAAGLSLFGLLAAYPLSLLALRRRARLPHAPRFAPEPGLHEASA